MNCANHQQNAASAYCRTCGKPLCTNCTRPVMGVIYCEQCLADRVAGSAAPANPYQASGTYQPGVIAPPGPHKPNPGLAGFLGAIPFGIGAIYNGQYTKGLVHLAIFVALVIALSSGNLPGYLYPVLGIFMGFFVVYQIIDAIKTAKAIQANEPPPDPFGLANMFSPGERTSPAAPSAPLSASRTAVPVGAVILIGLGVLFLLHNLGLWFLDIDVLWPLILIGVGVWLFIRRQTCIAQGDYRHRSLAGPAILVTIGGLALIDNLHGPGWDRTWPVILLVLGGMKLLERSGYVGAAPPPGPAVYPPSGTPPVQPPAEVSGEVKNG